MKNQVNSEAGEFLNYALQLEGSVARRAESIRNETRDCLTSNHTDARWVMMSVLGFLAICKSGIPGNTNDSIHQRLLLFSTFMQGAGITESTIMEGNYAKAAASLKQDFETAVRAIALRKLIRTRDGKLVNVQNIYKNGEGRVYGELNDIAHISKQNVLLELLDGIYEGDVAGVSPIPSLNPHVARQMYSTHLYITFEITREAVFLFKEMYPSSEGEYQKALGYLASAFSLMRETGDFTFLDSEEEGTPESNER